MSRTADSAYIQKIRILRSSVVEDGLNPKVGRLLFTRLKEDVAVTSMWAEFFDEEKLAFLRGALPGHWVLPCGFEKKRIITKLGVGYEDGVEHMVDLEDRKIQIRVPATSLELCVEIPTRLEKAVGE